MIRRACAALLCLLAFACDKPAESPAQPVTSTRVEDIPKYTTEPEPDYDADNLLNLAYGAAVVSRTGELTLEGSAIHAIDGSSSTAWTCPPGGPEQTMVFSLLAPSRLTRVGITTAANAAAAPTVVRFATSMDGTTWRELKKMDVKGSAEPQLVDVPPTNAQYIRLLVSGVSSEISIRSVHAIGTETRPPDTPPMTGCWRINGVPARFAQNGGTVTGVMATAPPTIFDGGSNGRVATLMWSQDPMWGYTAISITPDGAHVSGLKIHEEISTQQYGDGWFGDRIPCDGLALEVPRSGATQTRAPRWSMYGLVFDPQDHLVSDASAATLDGLAQRIAASPSQRFRLIAHELRNGSEAENESHTRARIESLRAALQSRGIDMTRIEFVAKGGAWTEPPIYTALQRLLGSRIDLERFGR